MGRAGARKKERKKGQREAEAARVRAAGSRRAHEGECACRGKKPHVPQGVEDVDMEAVRSPDGWTPAQDRSLFARL